MSRSPALIERRATAAAPPSGALLELMHEGFYMLFLLRNGWAPGDEQGFVERVSAFLAGFDSAARRIRADSDDIEAAKYAFCAAVDETILASPYAIRAQWERHPLQLLVFGDQLAGEHFFDRLDALRGKGAMRVQALQVFHLCLLLGFQGKYAIGGAEKLSYLTARLGDEIAHIKGRSRGFAPRAERPDQVVNRHRSEVPLWAMCSIFSMLAICAYVGLKTHLARHSQATLAQYADLVKLAPRAAHLTITLP